MALNFSKPTEAPKEAPKESEKPEVAATETTNETSAATTNVSIYTSHPISRFRLGRFRFVDATLRLDNETDVAEFERLLDAMPPRERSQIKKIDFDAANALVKARQPSVSKSFDSSVGRQESTVAGQQTVGTQPVFEND